MEPITGVAGSFRRKANSDMHKRSFAAPIIVADPSTNIGFRRHVRFWDRSNKGYITPIDTAAGFMNLGYNVIVSLTFGILLTTMLAYATQDSWIPDPRCRVHVQKLMRSKRRTYQKHQNILFDERGHFDNGQFDALFDKYAQRDISGNVITLSEVLQMVNEYNGYGASPTAWARAALEWSGLYLLVGKGGVFKKSDVHAVFDGTLFFRIRNASRLNLTGAAADSARQHHQQQASDLTFIPQRAVRIIEKQLNAALETLPRAASHVIERRFHSWLSGGLDEHRVGASNRKKSPLLTVVRRDINGFGDDDDDYQQRHQENDADTFVQERLTGTKYVSLDNQLFELTGVQGYHGQGLLPQPDENLAGRISDILLNGLRPDNLDDHHRETPLEDWVDSSTHLSGVRLLPTQHHVDESTASESSTHTSSVWFIRDPDDGDSKEQNEETSSYHNSMETFKLSGLRADYATTKTERKEVLRIVQLPDPEERDCTPDKSTTGFQYGGYTTVPIVRAPTAAVGDEKNEEISFNDQIKPSLLTGTHQEMFSIVEGQSQQSEESVGFEPVVLSGIRGSRHGEEEEVVVENSVHTHTLLPIVEAPATDRVQSFSYEPVVLSGLRPVFSFVQAPPEPEVPQPLANFEPVILSGLRGHDGYSSYFVQAPEDHHAKDVPPALELVRVTGSDDEQASSDEEPHTPTSIEPVALTGIRPADYDFTGFFQASPLYEPKATASSPADVELVPASLSCLRTDRAYTGFVQEPTTFEAWPVIEFDSSGLAGIRTDHEYTGFVQEPAGFADKKGPVDLQPASLSGLRADHEYIGFVRAPMDLEPSVPAADIEPASLSGLRKVGQDMDLPDFDKEFEKTPLSGLATRSDHKTITSHFVEAPSSGSASPTFMELDAVISEHLDGIMLCGVCKDAAPPLDGPLPIVEAPADAKPMSVTIPEKITLAGTRSRKRKTPLNNCLNMGVLEGVAASPAGQVYADPIEVPAEDDKEEQVDLEQYRRDFPLTGLSDTEHHHHQGSLLLKNWLNMDILPGTKMQAGPYAQAGESMPEDYIQAPEDDNIPYMGGNIPTPPTDVTVTPLKNWLNIDALPGTTPDTTVALYEKAVEVEEEIEPVVDLESFRAPAPLLGIDNTEVRLKNWLNTGALPGVVVVAAVEEQNEQLQKRPQQQSPSVYEMPGESMPDYVEIQEDMQGEIKALTGTAATNTDGSDDNAQLPLKNWLSLGALPGVQTSIYGEAKELTPEEYIEPPSPDMLGEAKLAGILSGAEEEQRCHLRTSTDETWDHTRSNSSATDMSHADPSLSPQPSATDKHDKLPMNWPSLAEIMEQKEE